MLTLQKHNTKQTNLLNLLVSANSLPKMTGGQGEHAPVSRDVKLARVGVHCWWSVDWL